MKRHGNIVLGLFLILSISVTVFVFSNSMQNSESSMAESDSVVSFLMPLLEKLPWLSDADFSKLIRKLAHYVEFFALGFFYGGTMLLTVRNRKREIFGVLFGVLFVAVIDEFIQTFTGRTSSVKDILLDFGGAVTGFAAVAAAVFLLRRMHHAKRSGTQSKKE